jgi:hypothetical protein
MVLFFSVPGASAATSALAAKSGHAQKAGCSQLTKAEVQSLIVNPITKETVKAVTAAQYTGSTSELAKSVSLPPGQGFRSVDRYRHQGPFAARAYAADVQGLSPRPVAVPGVVSEAVRHFRSVSFRRSPKDASEPRR